MDDAQGLAELLHSAKVAVVAVAILANRNIELDLVVGVVGLALSDIPRDARASKHDTGKGQVQGLSGGNNTNASQSLNPDAVVGKHFFRLVDAVTKLGGPLIDVIQQTNGNVLMNTTRANVCCVKTCAGNTFVELL